MPLLVNVKIVTSKMRDAMRQFVLRQKKIGIIPRGPYDVYINNKYIGSVGRYSSLSIPVEEDNFNLTIKHRRLFSSSKDCHIVNNNTIIEYEPVDIRLLIASVVWDVITIIAMLFHLKFIPYYVWMCGIFGLPVFAVMWALIRRKNYFIIEIADSTQEHAGFDDAIRT